MPVDAEALHESSGDVCQAEAGEFPVRIRAQPFARAERSRRDYAGRKADDRHRPAALQEQIDRHLGQRQRGLRTAARHAAHERHTGATQIEYRRRRDRRNENDRYRRDAREQALPEADRRKQHDRQNQRRGCASGSRPESSISGRNRPRASSGTPVTRAIGPPSSIAATPVRKPPEPASPAARQPGPRRARHPRGRRRQRRVRGPRRRADAPRPSADPFRREHPPYSAHRRVGPDDETPQGPKSA